MYIHTLHIYMHGSINRHQIPCLGIVKKPNGLPATRKPTQGLRVYIYLYMCVSTQGRIPAELVRDVSGAT